MSTIVPGPEDLESGDPAWIEPELRSQGALNGDGYSAYGRWKARYYSEDAHLADTHPLTVGLVGLRAAMARLEREVLDMAKRWREARDAPATIEPEEPGPAPTAPNDDPIVRAVVAVYDALEWIHSLDEHLKNAGVYANAADIDPVAGAFVEGAIGARNASHHGLRRVVGAVSVPPSAYVAVGRRWLLDREAAPEPTVVQVRWVNELPRRTEAKHAGKPALRIPQQEAAYADHLAGREVRNTLLTCWGFFLYRIHGEPIPEGMVFTPAAGPPPIDPEHLNRFTAFTVQVSGSWLVTVRGVGQTVAPYRSDVEEAARALLGAAVGGPADQLTILVVEAPAPT